MFPQGAGSRSQLFSTAAPVLHKSSSQRRAWRTTPETSKYVTVTHACKQHHMTVHSSASRYRSAENGWDECGSPSDKLSASLFPPGSSLLTRPCVTSRLPLKDTPLSAPRAEHRVWTSSYSHEATQFSGANQHCNYCTYFYGFRICSKPVTVKVCSHQTQMCGTKIQSSFHIQFVQCR